MDPGRGGHVRLLTEARHRRRGRHIDDAAVSQREAPAHDAILLFVGVPRLSIASSAASHRRNEQRREVRDLHGADLGQLYGGGTDDPA